MEELVSGLYRLHDDLTYLVAHVPAHGRSWQ